MLTVLVSGTYNATDAYPNVKYKIEMLREMGGIRVIETGQYFCPAINYRTSLSTPLIFLFCFFTLFAKSIISGFSVIRNRKADILYIPYPSIGLLFFIWFFPVCFRPKKIIVDAFISIYDTVVVDREILSAKSISSRILKGIEGRLYSMADLVIADTIENVEFLVNTFSLSKKKVTFLPLAINEKVYLKKQVDDNLKSENHRFRILFVGTFVPLHGIKYICDSLRLIRDEIIDFVFIGDGQQARILERCIKDLEGEKIRILWHKGWHSSNFIYKEIKQSDLCVGIMGNRQKTDRVWPFKNYIYMAAGKALVTADTAVSNRIKGHFLKKPFFTINPQDPTEFVKLIKELLKNKKMVQEVEFDALKIYQKEFSGRVVKEMFKKILITL
jgi:glycosyltransferase involved in cell wall biosynthesis